MSLTLEQVVSAVSVAFSKPSGTAHPYRKSDQRFAVYYVAMRYGFTAASLAQHFGKTRGNVYYGEGVATDQLTYNKDYQKRIEAITLALDNQILNSNNNDNQNK